MATRKTVKKKAAGRKTTGATSKRAARTGRVDALALLRADHRVVDELIKKFESARGASRKGKIAEAICEELTVHAQIEETRFYPALRESGNKKLADLLDEANVEHDSLKTLIAQIQSSAPGDDLYDAKVTVLGEYVKHHVKEEEKEMFPLARKTKLDLLALGEILAQEKQRLKRARA